MLICDWFEPAGVAVVQHEHFLNFLQSKELQPHEAVVHESHFYFPVILLFQYFCILCAILAIHVAKCLSPSDVNIDIWLL